MKTDDPVVRQLLQADEALRRRGLPAEVDARLRQRLGLEDGAPRASRALGWPWAIGTAAALAGVALLVVGLAGRPRPVGGFDRTELAAGAKVSVTSEAAVELTAGETATLTSDRERFTLTLRSKSARVRKEAAGARILRGTVEVQVDKRRRTEPSLRIAVSGGSIEVVGTRFTIVEAGQNGSVVLHEGAIVFRALDDRARTLSAGERLVWPLPSAAEPPPIAEPSSALVREESPVESAAPTPPRSKPVKGPARAPARSGTSTFAPSPGAGSAPPVPEVFSRVLELRSRGRYAAAATEIEQALERERQPVAREALLWELSSIIANQLHDRERGCRNARAYLREFPAGRFANETREAMRRLSCDKEPPN